MTNKQWEEIDKAVIEKLDSIDLLSEMNSREDLYDFMDRLEKKYPFKLHDAISLFDGFSRDSFSYYLSSRYKNKEMYLNEYTSIDVIKR